MNIKLLSVALAVASTVVLCGAFSQEAHADAGFKDFTQCGSVKGYTFWQLKNNPQAMGYAPYFSSQKSGNVNNCVKEIQANLNLSFCLPATRLAVDGSFGPKTKKAVMVYQAYWARFVYAGGKEVLVDGSVGPQTWGLMNSRGFGTGPYQNCTYLAA